ncbi:hypothetical protein F4561_002666 [Lipingzhangella halophila]|uniref:Uncharacterized protein n=1 Tax=Lipingzhangella halophila TaxID=1783352 RepID=A0A7W7W2J9_9ACTN|nr:hypothetical protein [Lipingzhangella halophila]MBB4931846.1 hypothetical protein [Lipingzhangella halophila]
MKAEEAQPSTPSVIRVERSGERLRILVDGEPLPCEVDANGVTTVVSVHHSPGITITIPADRVEVVDSLSGPVDEDRKTRARTHLNSLSPPGSRKRG